MFQPLVKKYTEIRMGHTAMVFLIGSKEIKISLCLVLIPGMLREKLADENLNTLKMFNTKLLNHG